jgi:hypothetical protein
MFSFSPFGFPQMQFPAQHAAAPPMSARNSNAPTISIDHEKVTEWYFDFPNKTWESRSIVVSFESRPFAEGSMRYCYKAVDHSKGDQKIIAKLYKTPEDRQTFFTEAEMQCTAAELAKKYNEKNPPKKIEFIIPRILEIPTKKGQNLIVAVENALTGDYKKYSNNFGWISPEDRNTPAAFSHFTYECTRGKMLVCDMQGVEDTYTDPQIHTPDLKFGQADLGAEGMQKFFSTHRCNGICRHLGLGQMSPAKAHDHGTKVRPVQKAAAGAAPQQPAASKSAPAIASMNVSSKSAPALASMKATPIAKNGAFVIPAVPIQQHKSKILSSSGHPKAAKPRQSSATPQFYIGFTPQYSRAYTCDMPSTP